MGDEWDCWEDEPVTSDYTSIAVSGEFVRMIEVAEEELAQVYKSMGAVSTPQSLMPNKKSLALMKVQDHAVVDALVAELDPALLEAARALFIPSSGEDIMDLTVDANRLRARFVKTFEPFEMPGKNYRADLFYDGYALFTGDKIVVASHDLADHLDYISANFPKDIWGFLMQARKIPRKSLNYKDLQDALRAYRAGRRLSKSLNKFSKVSQLEKVDYDNPFFWFDLDGEDLDFDDVVLVGEMPFQVRMRYSGCVYDPGLAGSYQDKTILANLVKGDVTGVYSVDTKLLAKVYMNCKDCTVFAHTVPFAFNPPPVVVRKPRPHNLAAVVLLGAHDPYGLIGHKGNFVKSNEWRNDRYLGNDVRVPLLRQERSVDYVLSRAGKVGVEHVREKKKKHITRSRLTRDDVLTQLSQDKNYKFGESFSVIPGVPRVGRLLCDVPAWGSAALVMNSLCQRAKKNGMQVVFSGGHWNVI